MMIKILVFGLVLIGAIALLVFSKQESNLPLGSVSPSGSVQPVYKGSPFPVASILPFLTEDFVKRQFDPKSKFIVGWSEEATPSADYPAEVTSVPEDQLQTMKCVPGIYSSPEGFDFSDPQKKKRYNLQINDEIYNQTIDEIKKDIGEEAFEIYEFSYCLLESGGKVVYYQRVAKNLNDETEVPDHFLLKNKEGGIRRVSMKGYPRYFGCNKALQLTNDDVLYFKCGGGDTTHYDSIYKLDFNTQTGSVIISCSQTELDSIHRPNPPLICE